VHVSVNGEMVPVDPPQTVLQLLDSLGFSGKPVAVEVNLKIVPFDRHSEYELSDGDELEVVTLVGGG